MKTRNILIIVLLLSNVAMFIYSVIQNIEATQQRHMAIQNAQLAEENAKRAELLAEMNQIELKKKDSIISVIYPIAVKADSTLHIDD